MSAVSLVKSLISGGVIFSTDGVTIKWDNGGNKIDDAVVGELRKGKAEIITFLSCDQRNPIETGKHEDPIFAGQSKAKSERRRVIPFPGREWTPDAKIRPDDPERYLDALRLHGPMSYGMAMRVLQWGGTRAGQAEDALLKQRRIKFNERGWAYAVDNSEDTNDRSS
ncbi:hypothetical protein [Brucella thiophenivorans]|uniref:TubC N-terminal docking domain-containing protein n=1 Tax=Brucella thiophenivorans TaxID=571255 RepID=A0A256FDW6_9HYPH|nr:hypothetical protein CEV31_3541 [Brucella thiophenivorans]